MSVKLLWVVEIIRTTMLLNNDRKQASILDPTYLRSSPAAISQSGE